MCNQCQGFPEHGPISFRYQIIKFVVHENHSTTWNQVFQFLIFPYVLLVVYFALYVGPDVM